MATLLEYATEHKIVAFEVLVLIEGRQIAVLDQVKSTFHAESWGSVLMSSLSAPADLESTREGDGWAEFALGDVKLILRAAEGVSDGDDGDDCAAQDVGIVGGTAGGCIVAEPGTDDPLPVGERGTDAAAGGRAGG